MKILVGCPTYKGYAYCIQEYLSRVRSLTFPSFDLALVDNSEDDSYAAFLRSQGIMVLRGPHLSSIPERITISRNILREYALAHGYDYLFSLEQDVIPPPDVLERLLAHNQKIVTGVYFKLYPLTLTQTGKKDGKVVKRIKALAPVLFAFSTSPGKMEIFTAKTLDPPRLLKVRASGLGCMLIHRSVLEQISFRFDPSVDTYDDVLFCNDLLDKGFSLYADTGIRCKHLILHREKKSSSQP